MKHGLRSSDGFTLLEVLIAMVVFAVFVTAYYTTQSNNVNSSRRIREDITLKQLATNLINELNYNPPEFKDSITLKPETKTFEEYPNYEYTIEYKKFEIPDLSKIKGNDENEAPEEGAKNAEKILYKNIKEGLQKMIWQVEVTVKNKETGYVYDMSSWLYNEAAQIKLSY